jgi:hypothetical protein
MKIIEALKKVKDLKRKADDLVELIKTNSAISSMESAKYGMDQKKTVDGWIQAHKDILSEISNLQFLVQKTNMATNVEIELPDGKRVTKTITEWIYRRRDLAGAELKAWKALSDRGIKEGVVKSPTGDPVEIKIVRFYEPAARDKRVNDLASEPSVIDGRLEIVNAVTELLE